MEYTNIHNVAPIFVRAVTNDDYTRGEGKYSVSDLIATPRMVWLKRRNHDKIVRDVSDMFAIFRGHGLHRELERHVTANSLSEERLSVPVDETIVTGKPDIYDGDAFSVEDLKSTSVWSFVHSDKPEWEEQLNFYAVILRANGFDVKRLTIHSALYDWNMNEARRNEDYPQTPFHTVDIPVWDGAKAEEVFINRVEYLNECETLCDDNLPLCSPLQRWESPTTYAIKKEQNKRATKVFESQDDADKFLEQIKKDKPKDKWILEVRQGENKRCLNYCDAQPFCNQAKDTQ